MSTACKNHCQTCPDASEGIRGMSKAKWATRRQAIGEMGNSPAGWGDVTTDACARGRWNNRFRQHVIRHVLDNSSYQGNVEINFYIQITQNDPSNWSRKFGNMRWLGLTDNVMLSNDGRLGLTSACHAIKTSKWIQIMLNANGFNLVCQSARQGLSWSRWRLAYQRNCNLNL